MKDWSLEKKRRVSLVSFLIVLVGYTVHATWNSIVLYNCMECSAPWHVEVLYSTFIFAFPLIVLVIVNVYYYMESKKSK